MMAGSGGFGAVGGSGVGGSDPGTGRGQIKQACESFCGPYSMACPGEAGSFEECTWSCLDDFGDAPRECRDLTLEALNCLGANFSPSLGCDQALLVAVDACFDLVDQAQDCNEGGPEPQPQPPCSSSGSVMATSCTATLTCGEQYYFASCSYAGENQSSCECKDYLGGGAGFSVEVSISSACDYALAFCGYPY
jgi:hypothetical protein